MRSSSDIGVFTVGAQTSAGIQFVNYFLFGSKVPDLEYFSLRKAISNSSAMGECT